jgi:hypothetical protein
MLTSLGRDNGLNQVKEDITLCGTLSTPHLLGNDIPLGLCRSTRKGKSLFVCLWKRRMLDDWKTTGLSMVMSILVGMQDLKLAKAV